MSIHIALDVALTEDADSLNHPYRQSVALAVHSAGASVFTGAAAQVESTPRDQVAVHRDRARHRACHARQVCRLRLEAVALSILVSVSSRSSTRSGDLLAGRA